MNKNAERFVAQIILEKLADCPLIQESGLLMAEWLFEVMQERRELIGLHRVIESKPQTVDCSELLKKIKKAVEL